MLYSRICGSPEPGDSGLPAHGDQPWGDLIVSVATLCSVSDGLAQFLERASRPVVAFEDADEKVDSRVLTTAGLLVHAPPLG